MKLNSRFLYLLAFVTLLLIVFNQLMWVRNMYVSYEQELMKAMDFSLEKAINMEVAGRINKMGGPMIVSFNGDGKSVNSKIIKRIHTEDTTFVVEVDKNDPNLSNKFFQFFFKKEYPLNVDSLKMYFNNTLKENGFPIRISYVEYYDLKSKKLLKSNKPKGVIPVFICSTEIVPIDIINTIGIKAVVVNSPYPILGKMIYQIALSFILMLIASFCLFYLLRTIFRQRKFEKMRQDFVNTMVHEFKRPISSASTMIELLPHYLNKNDTKKVEEYLAGSLLEFKKLSAYTDRIQRISNNNTDHILLQKQLVALVPFFESLKVKFSVSVHKVVVVDLSIETVLKMMTVDLLHFSNVMDNLMENAIKYSGNPVHIGISLKNEGQMLVISVTDDGIGIPDREKKSVFEKFYRVETRESREISGFGLGLTYVKAIVEAHGGGIQILNATTRGSVFLIRLPI